ncbi:type IV secretory system conjugative DNA transfer family protein [uncultured Ellagibacter sp.]|uniref:type IV secretory system conjugative DNA transfer family protein n=1 Tax=uncultured Ellagibacter sp. TaxID=2137580 RepID=UPI0025FFEBFA|nr:type IV secretory system conjugative DNA transfer family protein [uncultured Ellagibacter sp.]
MKATEFKTIAKDAKRNQLAQAFPAAKPKSEPACNPQRSAYQGETLLSANRSVNCDTWRSGLNNNVLVLGSSGGGKTRNHVKPNLLQCQGSYIVLDCKGSLYHEVGPYLEENGYIVDCIDFNAMDGTIGYNPLDHIRWCEGRPMQQDIISIASAICPVDEHASDSFWPLAAANYLTAYIAYVLEALPDDAQNMSSVIRMFELAVARAVDPLFTDLQKEDPRGLCARAVQPRKGHVRCGEDACEHLGNPRGGPRAVRLRRRHQVVQQSPAD